MPDLSIVMGTYNRLDCLKGCLGSLKRACNGYSYEVVITDGGSTDGTLDYLRFHPGVRLIEHGKPLGPVKAYNDAFAICEGEYVAYINDDLILEPGAFTEAINVLRNDPKVGVVSLPFTSEHDEKRKLIGLGTTRPDGKESEGFPMACFGVLRREQGKAVNWFGPWFYHYHGDSHICLSLQEKGLNIVALPHKAAHHMRLNNAVRGYAWLITGAKERSRHDGIILRLLWSGWQPRRETMTGLDRLAAIDLKMIYSLDTFIETGTYRGESCGWAAGEFSQVYSIESDERRHGRVVEQLGKLKNLSLILGDSRQKLPEILASLDKPALLWLDAHLRDHTKQGWVGNDQNPLKQELAAIAATGKRHVVMIDDANWIFAPPLFEHDPAQWPTLPEIEALLPNYDVLPRHGWNMLVAIPKEGTPTWE